MSQRAQGHDTEAAGSRKAGDDVFPATDSGGKTLRACLACGVCCFSGLETFVRVSGDDWARLGEAAERVAHFIGNRAYMRMNDRHCAALEVRTDAAGRREFFCTIYERRPQVCRDLERGSPHCEAELALKGDRTGGTKGAGIPPTIR